MTRKERYKCDPEYRASVNKANTDRYHRRIKDPEYAKIRATLGRIGNARRAIEHHEERARFFYKRLEADLQLIRKLRGKDI